MNTDLTLSLIRIFHAALSDRSRQVDPVEVNRVAMESGYIVEPKACTESVFEAMKKAAVNYKSTFYKDFEEVISRSRLELFIDQMLHYLSTYGTNYQGETFTLNPRPEAMAYKELTPVKAVSGEEMGRLCMEMLKSGVALKKTTLKPLADYLSHWFALPGNESLQEDFNPKDISNREGRCMLYDALNIIPEDPIEFIRVAVYSATGEAMLINSKSVLGDIRKNAKTSLRCLEMFGSTFSDTMKENLASVYFRYKDIFISFKQSFSSIRNESPMADAGVRLINYLRHLAPAFKRPLITDTLSYILNPDLNLKTIETAVSNEKSAFRLVRLLGYLKMMSHRPIAAQYIIRNGKTFIKSLDARRYPEDYSSRAETIADIVEDELVFRLSKTVSGKTIRYPGSIELTAPTSEKSFVGNYPFLSSYKMESETFIGVYWRNEWGTHDFDLSYISSENGEKIGWDADYYDENADIVFSGDMTDADPEASEILFFRKNVKDGIVFINRYNGDTGSEFRLFFGQGQPLIKSGVTGESQSALIAGNDFGIHRMDIRLEADMESITAQQMVGVITSGRFYFLDLGLGESLISSGSRKFPLDTALRIRIQSAVPLRHLLIRAGAIEVKSSTENPDIDLSERHLHRSSIIVLFQS